jgi:hypothetical protein
MFTGQSRADDSRPDDPAIQHDLLREQCCIVSEAAAKPRLLGPADGSNTAETSHPRTSTATAWPSGRPALPDTRLGEKRPAGRQDQHRAAGAAELNADVTTDHDMAGPCPRLRADHDQVNRLGA